jgi:hypothetical protein
MSWLTKAKKDPNGNFVWNYSPNLLNLKRVFLKLKEFSNWDKPYKKAKLVVWHNGNFLLGYARRLWK